MNLRPSGYEPDELPGCSTPRPTENGWAGRPGGDLLSRALGRSTMGAGGFHGRVRDGIGCRPPAKATRSSSPSVFRADQGSGACPGMTRGCRVLRPAPDQARGRYQDEAADASPKTRAQLASDRCRNQGSVNPDPRHHPIPEKAWWPWRGAKHPIPSRTRP